MAEPTEPKEYPPDVADAFERMGPPTDEFVGSVSTAAVAIFLGVLGLIVGVGGTIFVIYYIVERGFTGKALGAFTIPFAAVFGWYGLQTGLRNRFTRVYICEKGLVHKSARALALYPLDDITEIVQDFLKPGLDANGFPFMNRGTTFLVKRKDGGTLGVDANLLKTPLTFARRLYTVTRPLNIPWTFYTGK